MKTEMQEDGQQEESLMVMSNCLGNTTREFIVFADKASLHNFLHHLMRNDCKDYDIESVKKRCTAHPLP